MEETAADYDDTSLLAVSIVLQALGMAMDRGREGMPTWMMKETIGFEGL